MTDPFDPRNNPFEAPQAPAGGNPVRGASTFDLGEALRDGWDSCWSNFGAWLGASFAAFSLMVLSVFTIIGWIVAVPVLSWGYAHFALNAHDGHAEVGDIFAFRSRFGEAFASFLVLFILMVIAGLPGQALIWAAPFVGDEAGVVLSVLGQGVSLAWTFFVVSRLYLAPFYIVDQGMGASDALRESWDSTRAHKIQVGLMVIATGIVVLIGAFALLIGVIPAAFVTYGAWASAYRQISGTENGLARSAV